MKNWIDFKIIKDEWMKNLEVKQEYEALEPEYKITLELVRARTNAGFTQAELAAKMGTTQSVIARIESGKTTPSIKTLDKYAQAMGKQLEVHIT